MPEVELSSGTIDYEDTGGSGPVVVFVHGLMMDGSLWRHVIAELREEFRCVAPTLPLGGHRHPMRADADLSMRGVAELLGEVIERLDLHEVTLAMNDSFPEDPAPVPRVDVRERLREGPLMPPGVLGVVLALAVHVVGGLLEDLRSVALRVLAVRLRVLHAHEHRVCGFAGTWRYAAVADVANDHRAAFTNVHLRPMVLADLEALDEAESLGQPTHRGAHIGIDEHRDRGRARDRSVRQHSRAAYESARGRASRSVLLRPSVAANPSTSPRSRQRTSRRSACA